MSEFINKVWCPKCGYCSGDDWKQCQGLCPMKGSPHYNAELAAKYGEPRKEPPPKPECVFFQGYEPECLRCGKKLDEHPPRDFPDLTDVVERLKQYDRYMAELHPEWLKAETDEQVYALIEKESISLNGLRFAFWEATKDRNNWNHCRVVDEDFIRQLCKSWLHQKRNTR